MDGTGCALRQLRDGLRVMASPTPRHLLAFSNIGFASTFAIAFALTFAMNCACAAMPKSVDGELLKQLRQDVPDIRDCAPEQARPFIARKIDLSADDSQQYLLTATGNCMCGQVNCSQWVYRRGAQKWELLLETQGYSFTTGAAAHHGYRDVETRSRDNAVRVDILRYSFDGRVYQAAPARQSLGRAGGSGRSREVLFSVGTIAIRLQGRVSPDEAESWTLRAKKTQTMRLSLVDHDNAGITFTVRRPPGSDGKALAASAGRWEGTLPATGTYTVVVDAPRKGRGTYTLSMEVR